jgi:hypothetical protein
MKQLIQTNQFEPRPQYTKFTKTTALVAILGAEGGQGRMDLGLRARGQHSWLVATSSRTKPTFAPCISDQRESAQKTRTGDKGPNRQNPNRSSHESETCSDSTLRIFNHDVAKRRRALARNRATCAARDDGVVSYVHTQRSPRTAPHRGD